MYINIKVRMRLSVGRHIRLSRTFPLSPIEEAQPIPCHPHLIIGDKMNIELKKLLREAGFTAKEIAEFNYRGGVPKAHRLKLLGYKYPRLRKKINEFDRECNFD